MEKITAHDRVLSALLPDRLLAALLATVIEAIDTRPGAAQGEFIAHLLATTERARPQLLREMRGLVAKAGTIPPNQSARSSAPPNGDPPAA